MFLLRSEGEPIDEPGCLSVLFRPLKRIQPFGQVAQLVEHGPEKAGVAGSSPALTTFTESKTAPGPATSGFFMRHEKFFCAAW